MSNSQKDRDTKKLTELRNLIDRAAQCYYYESPIMSDQAFDALLEELRVMAPDDCRLTRVGFPVPPTTMRQLFKHTVFVGSLRKQTEAELRKWHQKHGGDLVVQLKGDGMTVVLYYTKGILARAVTRGGDDGVGEDVTANAIRATGVPSVLPNPITCAVRGEMVLATADWQRIVKETRSDDPSNPRNIGNGFLRRVEQNGPGAENLQFLAFDVTTEPLVFEQETQQIKFLKAMGFNVIQSQEASDIDAAMTLFADIGKKRQSLPYWIDGVVFKLNSLAAQKKLGFKDNRPEGQRVVKFEAPGAVTKLVDVVLTYGHTGAIIPNARFEPVEIAGTIVTNALLNNFEMIKELDLAIGDSVFLCKANDLVPKVTEVVDRHYQCPECGFEGNLLQQEKHHKI